jgi:hypothetical protein
LSYVVDKAVFIREYEDETPLVPRREAEDAWRAHYMARRVELYGDSDELAEAAYLKNEGKPVFTPNPGRRALPGGCPHEYVVEVAIYGRGRAVFVGALFENRAEKRHIELTSSVMDRLFRLSEQSDVFGAGLRAASTRPGPALGFAELDAAVRRFADDPQGFRELIEKDPKAAWVDAMPRAAVLARWGPKGDRAVRRL